ncbi:Homeodomain-like domain-containing protein [Chishuiella changwenlii]|uniref:Homeodomain-like domain-containing protein n=1 Tax=Chishuiella changwenlii TaxID=1434701 RepID=A0A1M7B8U2_9FLAO|nr:helix-turn-helix domain-containing protein [Chishuiella changwenlii]GGE96160.1 hypothetical protein GCM10010984_12090 [Chishuiella changwenlii]SHL51334.1 Homeodomain-like domain-containing protein [Chishuiella changwenlii]
MKKPNYNKIYQEIIERNFPEKMEQTKHLLKENMNVLDVINLSNTLSPKSKSENQKHKSYDLDFIKTVLAYQEKNKFINQETAEKYNLSRNTVTRWKKAYSS